MSKEAMKLALEALEDTLSDDPYPYSLESKAITALREALAKPDFWEGYVPEPVKPAQQHQDWCASVTQMLASMPPRPAPCDCKLAQPYKGIADHINQATNGGMRIDPVTGNVGIGTPSTPAQQALEKMADNARELGLDYEPVQEPVAWMDRDGDLYANEPDKNWCPPHYPLYTTPPAAQPAPDLQAELEATNRQVEILSDALAESRREVAQLKSQPAQQEPVLQDIEQYRLQMAGISTAAIGYWKEGDGILPDYDTIALRDVAKLYKKYDELYRAQRTWVGLTDEEADELVQRFARYELLRAIEAKLKEKNT